MGNVPRMIDEATRKNLTDERARLAQQIAAIDVLLGGETEPRTLTAPIQFAAGKGWTTCVRNALKFVPNEFTVRDVLDHVKNTVGPSADENSAQIGSILFKVAKADGLAVVKPGAGRRPTVYRKK